VRFWDSSAIVPFLFAEPSTPKLEELLSSDRQMLAWWTTRTEIISALTRSVREKRIPAHLIDTILNQVNRILDRATIIQPGPLIQQEAQRLLFIHPLRASDALQLAAAIVVTEGQPNDFAFVTLDHRLRAAAAMEGFTVQPI
jgi:uncharacterized protein